MSYWDRQYCATCTHGYGVHEQVRQPLRIIDGKVEFYESLEDAPQQCTGYPDRRGKCKCRQFVRPTSKETP